MVVVIFIFYKFIKLYLYSKAKKAHLDLTQQQISSHGPVHRLVEALQLPNVIYSTVTASQFSQAVVNS